MSKSLTLADERATRILGERVAAVAGPGMVICLSGPLGAGKTQFVKGMASGLGLSVDVVTSPTYVIVHEYLGGRLPLYHFDVFRVRDEDEFLELGPGEYFAGQGVCVLEWGERFADLLPADASRIELQVLAGERRQAEIRGPLAAALADGKGCQPTE